MKLIDADKLKESFDDICAKCNNDNPHKKIIMATINIEPAVLISCPRCYGAGKYDVPYHFDDGWDFDDCETHKCLICNGTGKITVDKYEEYQQEWRKGKK